MSFKSDSQRKAAFARMSLLRSTALQTRRWAERVQKANPGSERIYDAKFSKDLSGFCLRAASRLAAQLQKKGIRAKVLVATPGDAHGAHAFVETGGYILDVTATQFGGPKVRVLPKKKMDSVEAWTQDYYLAGSGPGYGRKPLKYTAAKVRSPQFRKNMARNWGWVEGAPQPQDFKRFNKKAYK
jgi:hypothetical protein